MNPRGRLALLLLGATALVTGLAGGLARLGLAVPAGDAAALHGALMAGGFLGTVISLERAVALGGRWPYAAPLASGLGTLLMLAGWHAAGLALWVMAPLLLVAASAAIVRRQPAAHTVLLLVAAAGWVAGSVLFALGRSDAAPAWWFAFLVLTIAAERLEMTRLTRRPAIAVPLFGAIVALLVVGAGAIAAGAAAGPVAYGIALIALAAWLAAFDIARRTVATTGFSRYAAVALLGGYAWLGVAGAAWTLAPAYRDAAVHALALGFVFSMIFAHAPLIVPVVLARRLAYAPMFYVPLGLLHASLALRLWGGSHDAVARMAGGILNAASILAFAILIIVRMAREPAPEPLVEGVR